MSNLVLFIILSVPLIFLSWKSLLRIHHHGLYRLLAWECILWLLISNIRFWFFDSLSVSQIISWGLLVTSLYFVITGILLFKQLGGQSKIRKDPALYTFEKTTSLIRVGIFKYIRHPMYSSLLFLTWGIFFKNTSITLLLVSLLSSLFLYITARLEEIENIGFFGPSYLDYMKKSKMFIPFVF